MYPHVNHEGAVTVVETVPFVLLELTGDQYELLLYADIAFSNLPKLQHPMVSRTHLRETERLDQHHKYNDCQRSLPKTPICNPPNQTKTGVTQETVLACVRLRLILARPDFHVTTVLRVRCLPVEVSQVPFTNLFVFT